jgi:hypothetical protein
LGQQQQQQQQQAVKPARPARSAAAGAAAATAAAGARRFFDDYDDASKRKAMIRSANSRAAVARRWANYRAQKAAGAGNGEQGAAGVAAAAAASAAAAGGPASGVGGAPAQQQQQPALQLPLLGGRKLSSDISTVNAALLSVSDVMKLPEELVMGLSKQILQALRVAAAAAAPVAAALQDVAGNGDGQTGGGVGSVQEQLHAGLKSWYQQLQGAVSERNGAMVAQLVEELRVNVLPAAS